MSGKVRRLSLDDFAPRTADFEITSPLGEVSVVGIKILSDTEFDAIMKSVPDPEPQKWFDKERKKFVPNLDDPAYKAAVAESGRERTYRLLAATVDVPFPGDTFADKAKAMRAQGVPSWLLMQLAKAVYRMMGLEPAEVEQRAEVFQE